MRSGLFGIVFIKHEKGDGMKWDYRVTQK